MNRVCCVCGGIISTLMLLLPTTSSLQLRDVLCGVLLPVCCLCGQALAVSNDSLASQWSACADACMINICVCLRQDRYRYSHSSRTGLVAFQARQLTCRSYGLLPRVCVCNLADLYLAWFMICKRVLLLCFSLLCDVFTTPPVPSSAQRCWL
jgi:hypothetical protein